MELLKALPESLALQFLKNELGDEALNEILDKKHDFYAKEKNNDPNKEPALLYADGIDYLEINKGAIELYSLSEVLGFDKFNTIVSDYVQTAPNKNLVFKSLYNRFINELPQPKKVIIKDKFEKVN